MTKNVMLSGGEKEGGKAVLTVIPSRGQATLYEAIKSALPASDVLIVTDDVSEPARPWSNILGVTVLNLPYRVGGGNWSGHRIYAAIPHLVNHRYIAFLDEDNWYEPDHLSSCIEALEQGAKCAFSYRRIVDQAGNYICDDKCESLGPVRGWRGRHLVDTSSYVFETAWLRSCSNVWDWPWGADQRFFDVVLKNEPELYRCTFRHTVNYRLGGETTVNGDNSAKFFLDGNAAMGHGSAGAW